LLLPEAKCALVRAERYEKVVALLQNRFSTFTNHERLPEQDHFPPATWNGNLLCVSRKSMMDLLQLFRRHSSRTISGVFRSCDIEWNNDESRGTCWANCYSGLSGFSASYLHDHVSSLVFAPTSPGKPLSKVTGDEIEITMRDASLLGTERDCSPLLPLSHRIYADPSWTIATC
jgi:hypothetical protein